MQVLISTCDQERVQVSREEMLLLEMLRLSDVEFQTRSNYLATCSNYKVDVWIPHHSRHSLNQESPLLPVYIYLNFTLKQEVD